MLISDYLNKIETLLNISLQSGLLRVSLPKNQQIIAGIKQRFQHYKWDWKYGHRGPLPVSFIISKDDKVIFNNTLGTEIFYLDLIAIIENLILEEKLELLLEDK